MPNHCFASFPPDADEPVPAIRQFVRLLRDSGVATDRGEVDLGAKLLDGRSGACGNSDQVEKGRPFALNGKALSRS